MADPMQQWAEAAVSHEGLMDAGEALYSHANRLEAENERLRAKCDEWRGYYDEAEDEALRLCAAIRDHQDTKQRGGTIIDHADRRLWGARSTRRQGEP